jgi:hypothetical protein
MSDFDGEALPLDWMMHVSLNFLHGVQASGLPSDTGSASLAEWKTT